MNPPHHPNLHQALQGSEKLYGKLKEWIARTPADRVATRQSLQELAEEAAALHLYLQDLRGLQAAIEKGTRNELFAYVRYLRDRTDENAYTGYLSHIKKIRHGDISNQEP